MKPSTRQRFLAIGFDFLNANREAKVIEHESACTSEQATRLVDLAHQIRAMRDLGLRETASTRLLIYAGRLLSQGIPPREACIAAIVEPLSDDPDIIRGLTDLVALRW